MWQKINVKQTNKDENPLNPVTTKQLPRFSKQLSMHMNAFITCVKDIFKSIPKLT